MNEFHKNSQIIRIKRNFVGFTLNIWKVKVGLCDLLSRVLSVCMLQHAILHAVKYCTLYNIHAHVTSLEKAIMAEKERDDEGKLCSG